MANGTSHKETPSTNERTPTMLNIRDVVLIVAGVVSIVAAWGLYGTRLTLVESKLLSVNEEVMELKLELKNIEGMESMSLSERNEMIRRLDKVEYDIKAAQEASRVHLERNGP